MMTRTPSILGKVILLMQITAWLLIQGYALPALSAGVTSYRAVGVKIIHHRCGCAPEKVASKTCCCYTGKCSSPANNPAATCCSSHRKPATSQTLLIAGACLEEEYGTSLGKCDFLGASSLLGLGNQMTRFSQLGRIIPKYLLFGPPVPPPEMALSAQPPNLI